jgi:hypothetical protein
MLDGTTEDKWVMMGRNSFLIRARNYRQYSDEFEEVGCGSTNNTKRDSEPNLTPHRTTSSAYTNNTAHLSYYPSHDSQNKHGNHRLSSENFQRNQSPMSWSRYGGLASVPRNDAKAATTMPYTNMHYSTPYDFELGDSGIIDHGISCNDGDTVMNARSPIETDKPQRPNRHAFTSRDGQDSRTKSASHTNSRLDAFDATVKKLPMNLTLHSREMESLIKRVASTMSKKTASSGTETTVQLNEIRDINFEVGQSVSEGVRDGQGIDAVQCQSLESRLQQQLLRIDALLKSSEKDINV